MANEHRFTAGEGAIWMQPSGPGTDLTFLGCHQIESIDEPLGDYTPLFCPDNTRTKAWRAVGETASPPGAVTATITEDVTDALSYLREAYCPFPVYVNMVKCGRKDVFENADKTFILDVRKVTNRSISNPVMMESDERVQQSFDLAANPPLIEVRGVVASLVGTTEDDELRDIVFYSDLKCASGCGSAEALGEKGFIVMDSDGVAAAAVLYTTNSGQSWSSVAGPFAIGEDVYSGTAFAMDKDTTRWLVARATDGATPMEIAYSDNSGTTWVVVATQTAGTEGAVGQGALFSLDKRHIWLGTSGGNIDFSSDGGVTWTSQADGTVTVKDVYAIHFSNNFDGVAVCADGVVLKTSDGGTTWSTVTAIAATPDLYAVYMFDSNRIIVGTANGKIYMTFDGGTTWEEKLTLPLTSSVTDVKFVNEFVGYASTNTVAPVGTVYRTRDGGETWESVTTPTNAGLNSVAAITSNLAWTVGAGAATSSIIKING